MICGHCKTNAVDVSHVRNCSTARTAVVTTAPVRRDPQAQMDADDRDMNAMVQAAEHAEDARVAAYKARRDSAPAVQLPLIEVPDAKYALPNAQGVYEFFKVDVPAKGKWVGHTFVKKLIGAPGDWRKVNVNRSQADVILDRIRNDFYADSENENKGHYGPSAGSIRYARVHERCSVCDSPLSDPVSMARGRGPVCDGRFSV